MRLIPFVARSILVSINVALRMIPILMFAGFSIYMLFELLKDQPLALFLVLAAIYIPLIVFLFLNAIRCGLVALRATGAPVVKKLIGAVWRFMRFNFMIFNLSFGLIGVGGSALVLMYLTPDVWQTLSVEFRLKMLFSPTYVWDMLNGIPLVLFPILSLAVVTAGALMGTNAAALCAWVAERGPNHDAIWGITSQFVPLFALGLTVLVGPSVAAMAYLGTPLTGIVALGGLPTWVYVAVPFYLAWTVCVMAAGMALAYVRTLAVMEAAKQREFAEREGLVAEQVDLRALRESRQRPMAAAHD